MNMVHLDYIYLDSNTVVNIILTFFFNGGRDPWKYKCRVPVRIMAQPSCLPVRLLLFYKLLFSGPLTDLMFLLWDIWVLFQA